MLRATKDELLAKYAEKPVNRYLQMDCFVNVGTGDDVMRPDSEGDSIFGGLTDELRMTGGPEVRIQIAQGVTKDEALRAIKKLAAWVETGYQELWYPPAFTLSDEVPF